MLIAGVRRRRHGKLVELRFVEAESAFDDFAATRVYLSHHGRPAAFYSDKHSIFRNGYCQTCRLKAVQREVDELEAKAIPAFNEAMRGEELAVVAEPGDRGPRGRARSRQ